LSRSDGQGRCVAAGADGIEHQLARGARDRDGRRPSVVPGAGKSPERRRLIHVGKGGRSAAEDRGRAQRDRHSRRAARGRDEPPDLDARLCGLAVLRAHQGQRLRSEGDPGDRRPGPDGNPDEEEPVRADSHRVIPGQCRGRHGREGAGSRVRGNRRQESSSDHSWTRVEPVRPADDVVSLRSLAEQEGRKEEEGENRTPHGRSPGGRPPRKADGEFQIVLIRILSVILGSRARYAN